MQQSRHCPYVSRINRQCPPLAEETLARRDGAFFKEGPVMGGVKLLPGVLERIQGKLDQGRSSYSIAKEEGISEGSIRYAIGLGRLKKVWG